MTNLRIVHDAEQLRAAIGPVGTGTAADPIANAEPWQTCPRCLGSDPAPSATPYEDCRVCDGTGVLDVRGEPFHAPPPFDTWTPQKLVDLAAFSRSRQQREPAGQPVEQPKPARLTQRDILERLLDSRGRLGQKSTACTIGRSARGVVTWELSATADPEELEHLTAAVDAVIAQHDRLTGRYPITEGE